MVARSWQSTRLLARSRGRPIEAVGPQLRRNEPGPLPENNLFATSGETLARLPHPLEVRLKQPAGDIRNTQNAICTTLGAEEREAMCGLTIFEEEEAEVLPVLAYRRHLLQGADPSKLLVQLLHSVRRKPEDRKEAPRKQ